MNRTTRVAITFALGAVIVAAGLMLLLYCHDVERTWRDLWGTRYDPLHSVTPFVSAAQALLLGGLMIEGLAMLGWILTTQDDR